MEIKMRRLCRLLFSRYSISAILILIEVVIIVYFPLGKVTAYVAAAISAIASVIALVSLINKDTNPEYKIPWTVLIVALMPLGAALYFLFYTRRISRREARLLRGAIGELCGYDTEEDVFPSLSEENALASGKARAIMAEDPLAEVYRNSHSELFDKGEELFTSLISDIKTAEHFIFLEYFIIGEGTLWDEIHAVLVERAGAGVDVRVLYDDIGCMSTLPRHYESVLCSEGIRACRFAKVSPRVSSVHHNRDHRKICVVDGRVAYTGGVNIADEYANRIERFGYWKDGGVRVCGDAVRGFTKLFLSTWDVTSGTVSDYETLLSLTESVDGDGGYYSPFGSGPAPIYKRPVGKDAFLNLINQSQRYVYITTPYLIIDYDLTEAICNAAMRGVDVRIVTPGIADKKIIKIMTKSAYPYLIDAGVRIYEYAPGFIHEKCAIVDGEYAIVGTINLDYRSMVHHFECAVWMYNTPTTESAAAAFERTLASSRLVTRDSSRLSFTEWVFRLGIKLFSPLL